MTDHAKQALLDLKAHQQSGSYRLCSRCGRNTMKENLIANALSRHADIYICDASVIAGYDENHRVQGVLLENVTECGCRTPIKIGPYADDVQY